MDYPVYTGRAGPGVGNAIQPLNPDEEQTLLGKIGSGTLGGLGYAGSVLQKTFGGRAIRGLLGGHPDELLSPIPLSDTLGITDPTREVRGEKLLQDNGLIEPNDPSAWELRDFAGPAAEIALDPATYLSFGGAALTDAGRAAKMAGTLEPTLAGRIAAGQGGLAGVGLPFMEPAGVLGTGATSERIAQGLGSAWDKAAYSAPGRYASELFDPTVTLNGITARSAAAQRAFREMNKALPGMQAAEKLKYLSTARDIQSGGILNDINPLRQASEGTLPLPPSPADLPLHDAGQAVRDHYARYAQEAADLGRPVPINQDQYAQYAARYKTPGVTELKGPSEFSRQQFGHGIASDEGRLDAFRHIPGGTAGGPDGPGLNALLQDQQLKALSTSQGANPIAAADFIRNNYLKFGPAEEAEKRALEVAAQAGPLPTASADRLTELTRIWDQSHDLARITQGLDPRYADQGLSFFGNNPLTDLASYGQQHVKAQATTQALYDMLGREATAGGGEVGLSKVLADAGLTPGGTAQAPAGGALGKILEVLKGQGKIGQNATVNDLLAANMGVSREVALDATKGVRNFQMPGALQPAMGLVDSFTNLMRAGTMSMWPAFHARNLASDVFRGVEGGATSPLNVLSSLGDAEALRGTGALAGSADRFFPGQGLSDLEASAKLRDLAYAHSVTQNYSLGQEVIGQGAPRGGVAGLPGDIHLPGDVAEPSMLGAAGKALVDAIPKTLDEAKPWKVAGVAGQNVDTFAPVAAGKALGNALNDSPRLSSWLSMMEKGWDPGTAAAEVNRLHFDYGALTPFEKNVMRRLVPLGYTWMRKNIPFNVGQVLERPGGLTANLVKTVGAASTGTDQGYTPEYIREGASLNLGEGTPAANGDTTQRYLTGLGLPYEGAFDLLSGGPNAIQRTLQKGAASLNPLLKAPLELAAGKQFFSGRDLNDLYGPTGEPALDQLIMNSPLSRAYTTGRTLVDERKGLLGKAVNLLSPASLTDVDMTRQSAVELRKTIEENLAHNPNVRDFSQLYVNPDNVANLTPDELQLMRLYRTIEQQKGAKPINFPVR